MSLLELRFVTVILEAGDRVDGIAEAVTRPPAVPEAWRWSELAPEDVTQFMRERAVVPRIDRGATYRRHPYRTEHMDFASNLAWAA